MDTYYRLFHGSYEESLKSYHSELSDLFASVMEKVEGLYTNWFLGTLGRNWSDAASEDLSEYGRILEVPEQKDFYRRKIASSDSRVYVIISDAMRYEVAASLADQLRREAAFFKFYLDAVENGGTNDRLMVALDIVLRNLALVDLRLFCQVVHGVGLSYGHLSVHSR